MIVMDVQIDNFFAFKNFRMNMAYPKKIVNSYIQDEFLEGYPNFRYKKVNILMGSNATGKTSFGQMLMRIFNFIEKKQYSMLTDVVSDTAREATLSIDFVVNDAVLYRMLTIIDPKSTDGYESPDIHVCVKKTPITQKDNYESCSKRLDKMCCDAKYSFVEELEEIKGLSWLFEYPSETLGKYKIPKSDHRIYVSILEKTLRALDPSIIRVEAIDAVEDSFVIRMKNKDIIMQDGKLVNTNILSSGTRSGIAIANVMVSIINGRNGFYYCDEKFSYIHSDIERAFLSVMIDSLKKYDQLFFTTHNTDILDLPLPKHSFVFLKKDIDDEEQPIKCINASDFLKRSTDSLRNAVENDLFSVAPNVELIYKIGELSTKED